MSDAPDSELPRQRHSGRPRLSPDAPGVTVSTSLPRRMHEKLVARAAQERTTVSAAVRAIVVTRLTASPPKS